VKPAHGIESPASPPGAAGQIERIISTLLRTGVAGSLLIILTGLALMFFWQPGHLRTAADLARLTGFGAEFPHTLRGVGEGLLAGRGQAVIAAGLLLLILTPILRVAVSIVMFVLEKDRPFVLITAAVLATLVLSFLLGKAG
jgi:uncharacterized membrane protein